MYVVSRLSFDDDEETRIWISDRAKKALASFVRKHGTEAMRFTKKLEECAARGFQSYHGTILIPEGERTFRFGIRSSLFRLIGFYDTGQDFVFLEALTKPGQELSAPNIACIDRVIDARAKHDWERADG